MKLIAATIKSWKENIRNWKILALVLTFSPFFLILIYLFYGQSPTTYKIGMINLDNGNASIELTKSIQNIKGQDDIHLFQITEFQNEKELQGKVKDKTIDIGIVIPKNYSEINTAQVKQMKPVAVHFYGSMSNMRYMIAAVLVSNVVNQQGLTAMNTTLPTSITETFLEKNLPSNEFDSYVPGLISLAVLMLLFTATASIVKENDQKTLIRLKLSKLGSFHFIMGICIVQAVIATVAIAIAYWTALALGYRPEGSFGSILFVGLLSSLSMVSISVVVASFLNTIFDVLTIGCFPFFILMFFSGCMFPLPKINIFTISGYSLGITDILPLTHTVNAYHKILDYGAGIPDILFEILMIILLTAFYFSIGLLLYKKRKLSKA
jgi:ABC-type multidrug transport system, permease component